MRTDRRRETHMRKLTVAFRNFAYAPEIQLVKEVYEEKTDIQLKIHSEQKMDLHSVDN